MINLSDALDQMPGALEASSKERQEVLTQIHDRARELGVATSQQLREFREGQVKALYDDEVKRGNVPPTLSFDDWRVYQRGFGVVSDEHIENQQAAYEAEKEWRERIPNAEERAAHMFSSPQHYADMAPTAPRGEYNPEADTSDIYAELSGRNMREYLRDWERLISDGETWEASLLNYKNMAVKGGIFLEEARNAATLKAMSWFVGVTEGPEAQAAFDAKLQGSPEALSELLKEQANTAGIQQYIEDVTKDDPELFMTFNDVLVDATVGAAFGMGRARSAWQLGKGAGEALSGWALTRQAMAPVVSNITSGRLVSNAIDGLDASLEEQEISPETRAGVKLLAGLALGFASGVTLDNVVEQAVGGKLPSAVKAVEDLSKAAVEAEASGIPLRDVIANHPELTDSTRAYLLETTGQNLDATAVSARMAQIDDIRRKMEAGEPLSIEEAEASLPFEFTFRELPDFEIEEIADDLGELSSLRALDDEIETAEEEALRMQRVREEEALQLDTSSQYLEGAEAPADATTPPRIGPKVATAKEVKARQKAALATAKKEASELNKQATLEYAGSVKPVEDLLRKLRTDREGAMQRIASGGGIDEAAKTVDQLDSQIKAAEESLAEAQKRLAPLQKQADKAAAKAKALEPPKKTKQKKEAPTWDSLPVKRSVITRLADLANKARQLAKLSKTDPSVLSELKQVEAEVEDLRKYLALEVNGRGKTVELAARDISKLNREIAKTKGALKKTKDPEARGQLQKQLATLQERLAKGKALKDVLARTPEKGKWTKDTIRAYKQDRVERLFKKKEAAPSAPYVEKITRTDALTRLEELPGPQRLMAMKVARNVQMGMEDLLGRSLTEEENLDILGKVLTDPGLTGQRMYTPGPSMVFMHEGMPQVRLGNVEETYPIVARVFTAMYPASAASGAVTADKVLHLCQSLTARSGLGMDADGWFLQKDLLHQAYKLWDDVREAIPKGEGATIESLLMQTPGIGKVKAHKLAAGISAAFPELDIAWKADVLPRGVAATADALTKLITVGVDDLTLGELYHELGHMNFFYALDADARMAWMEGMRRWTADEASWAAAFPGYSERMALVAEGGAEAVQKQARWVHNPAEMYAQQFSAYMRSGELPAVSTLTTFQKAWKGIRKVMGLASDDWDKLPKDTQRVIIRTLAGPSPSSVQEIPNETVRKQLESSWLYSNKADAEDRVLKLREGLRATYGMRTAPMTGFEQAPGDAIVAPPQVDFFSLPVEDRVAAYSVFDLPDVVEMQALSYLYDMAGADLNEALLAMRRLSRNLSDESVPDLIDFIMARNRPITSDYDPEFDPAVGYDYTKGERRQHAEDDRYSEYNRMDSDAKREVKRDFARKKSREYAQAFQVAERHLVQAQEAGRIQKVTKEDIRMYTERVLAGDVRDSFVAGIYNEWRSIAEAAYTNDDALAAALHQVAAMNVNKDALEEFLDCAMHLKGDVQLIDPDYVYRLSKADEFARALTSEKGRDVPFEIVKAVMQGAYVGVTGLEYDPDATPIPFLGRARWSPEKFWETAPLGVLLVPGAQKTLRFGGRFAGKFAKTATKKVFDGLPAHYRQMAQKSLNTFKQAFMYTGGGNKDLLNLTRRAQIFGRTAAQEFKVFGESMWNCYSKEDRDLIARVFTRDLEPGEFVDEILAQRPDIAAAVDMTQRMYARLPEMFREVGLSTDVFKDPRYLNRLYKNFLTEPGASLQISEGVSPLRAKYLRKRGVEMRLTNTKKTGEGLPEANALGKLRKRLNDESIELEEGLKLNAWQTSGGEVIYSVPESAWDNSLRDQGLTPVHVWGDNSSGYYVDVVDKGAIKLRRDYTREERKAMGEVTDVAIRSVAMAEMIQRDLQKGKLFHDLSKSSWARRTENPDDLDQLVAEGWQYFPKDVDKKSGLLKWGALADSWVHPDAVAAMKSLEPDAFTQLVQYKKATSPGWHLALAAHGKLLNAWKLGKTVWQPAAHMNNFVSNILMGFLTGHNVVSDFRMGLRMSKLRNLEIRHKSLLKQQRFEEAARVQAALRSDPDYAVFSDIRAANLADSSLWASELRSEEMLAEMLDESSWDSYLSEAGNMQKLLGMGCQKIYQGVSAANKQLGGWYEKGDLIFKMGAFANARRGGADVDAALDYAYTPYFDYGTLPPAFRAMRASGITPFISYTVKAIPALTKAVTQHPERLALVGLMLEGLHLASIASVYGSDELVYKREALDESMPEYMQKRGLGGLFRTRILDPTRSGAVTLPNGGEVLRSSYLDMARMLPGADLMETGAGISDIDFSMLSAGELLYKVIGQSPVINWGVSAATGKNAQLGTSLWEGGNLDVPAVEDRKAEKFLELTLNTISPNLPFLPWTYNYSHIQEALAGAGVRNQYAGKTGLDVFGMPKSLGNAVAASVGWKFRDHYPELTAGRQSKHLKSELNKEKSRIKKLLNPSTTQEELASELEKFRDTAEKVGEKQKRKGEILQRLRAMRAQTGQGGQSLPR